MARDIIDVLAELRARRVPHALAIVVEMIGSVSAKTGSKAVIDRDGQVVAGWVGGGCAESAVRQAGLDCMASGNATVIEIDLDDEVLGAGMPCGGSMRVYVEPILPKPRLWIVGHGRIAECMCEIGDLAGLEVMVDDPGASPERFPLASRVIDDDLDGQALDPGPGDYVVIATQHKGDHESVQRALESGAPYIALIASRKRAGLVLRYLREAGLPQDQLDRVVARAGLDLGARTPEEIALAVIAEIVMLRRGGTGVRMRDREPRPEATAPRGARAPTALRRTVPACGVAGVAGKPAAAAPDEGARGTRGRATG